MVQRRQVPNHAGLWLPMLWRKSKAKLQAESDALHLQDDGGGAGLHDCRHRAAHGSDTPGNKHRLYLSGICYLPPKMPLTIDHIKINIVNQGADRKSVAVSNNAILFNNRLKQAAAARTFRTLQVTVL